MKTKNNPSKSQDSYSTAFPELNYPLFNQTLFNASPDVEPLHINLDNSPYLEKCGKLKIFPYKLEILSTGGTDFNQIPKIHQRGNILTFSRKSKRRLNLRICALDLGYFQTKLFATFTFGNNYPKNFVAVNRYLVLLKKQIQTGISPNLILWRKELQKRGAPHFHLLIFFKERITASRQREIASRLKFYWGRLTHPVNPYAYTVASDVREANTSNKLFSYLAKYVSKIDENEKNVKIGRVWGLDGEQPQATAEEFFVSENTLKEIREAILNNYKLKIEPSNEFSYYLLNANHIKVCVNSGNLHTILRLVEAITHDSEIQEILRFMKPR